MSLQNGTMPPKTKAGEYRPVKFQWRGREWEIRPLSDGEADLLVGADKIAALFSNSALVAYRASIPRELAIMAILHEFGHEMFPEWTEEPHEKSASEVGIFERDMKSLGDAVGLDWSPLLGG